MKLRTLKLSLRLLCAVACLGALAVATAAGQPPPSGQLVQPEPAAEPEWVDLRRQAVGPHEPGLRVSGALAGGLEPVDQAVGDLDELSRSLRLVEPGHARFPEHARVYRLHPEAPGMWSQLGDPARDRAQRHHRHTYRYEAPGVRAWLRRPSYLVRGEPTGFPLALDRTPQRDGEFRELVPADTVFDLIPQTRRPAPASGHVPSEQTSDARLDYRIDTRIDTRIDMRVEPSGHGN